MVCPLRPNPPLRSSFLLIGSFTLKPLGATDLLSEGLGFRQYSELLCKENIHLFSFCLSVSVSSGSDLVTLTSEIITS